MNQVLGLATIGLLNMSVVHAATLGELNYDSACLAKTKITKFVTTSGNIDVSCNLPKYPSYTGSASFDLNAGNASAIANQPAGNPNGAGIGVTSIAGDVLTITIPGARPITTTNIPISATFNGVVQTDNTPGSNNFVLVSFDANANSEAYVPGGSTAARALKLPQPKKSTAPFFYWLAYGPEVDMNLTQDGTLSIQGATAVIPLFVFLGAYPNQNEGSLENVSLGVTWTLTLPPGASCHSRSGMALGGACGF